MRLAVLKERRGSETRVAVTPDTVKRLIGLGLTVAVETGAGASAAMPDAELAAAGAEIVADPAAVLAGAGIVFAVQAPLPEERALIPRGALLVCTAGAFADPTLLVPLAATEAGIDCAAMELLPRITRAQSMDVLSSLAYLAGYRAVIESAFAFQRGFPMMMTATAGTCAAGAPVRHRRRCIAGLQAIATARRLGAIVSATCDVRARRGEGKKSSRSAGRLRRRGGRGDRRADQDAYAKEMSDAFPPEAGRADGDDGGEERHRRLHRPGDGVARRYRWDP